MNTEWDAAAGIVPDGGSPKPIRIVASEDVHTFVREHGGRLCVWTVAHRHPRITIVLLETETDCPDGPMRHFERLDAGDFELYFDPGGFGRPEELVLELEWRRKRVKAYWDDHAYIF